jgi:hypothetical protein
MNARPCQGLFTASRSIVLPRAFVRNQFRKVRSQAWSVDSVPVRRLCRELSDRAQAFRAKYADLVCIRSTMANEGSLQESSSPMMQYHSLMIHVGLEPPSRSY